MKVIMIREIVETAKKCNSRISINIKGSNDHNFSNLNNRYEGQT